MGSVWGVRDTWSRLHVQSNQTSVKKKKKKKRMRDYGVGIFSSRILSMKPTLTSSITEMFKGKDGTLLSLSLNIHRVFLAPAGGGGWNAG